MSVTAPVFKYLRNEVLRPVEMELIGKNRPGNFSSMRSCGSDRSLDSYHMSIPQLRECGSDNPYSLRMARDRAAIGTDMEQYADGLDIAFPAQKLRAFSKALVEIVRTDPAYARDVREIIYTPDGKTVLRWDAKRGMASTPRPGEADNSHLWHTHLSQYRDAPNKMGTAELVIRGLQRGGLITTERMQQFLDALYPPKEPDVTPAEVKELQVALNQRGTNPPLVVDGDYGPLTRAAVLNMNNLVESQIAAAKSTASLGTKTAAIEAIEALPTEEI